MKESKTNRTSKMLQAYLELDECKQKVRDLTLQLELVESNRDHWEKVSNKYKDALMTILYWDCDICKQHIPSTSKFFPLCFRG